MQVLASKPTTAKELQELQQVIDTYVQKEKSRGRANKR
jgi:hypothetical protein